MLKKIEEYGKLVSITGLRNVSIGDIDQLLKTVNNEAKPCAVQLFDADCIAGSKHLFFTTLNAMRSMKQKRNISDSLAMETMLYASGQRQIRKALDTVGIKPSTSRVALLLIDSDEDTLLNAENRVSKIIAGVRDDEVLEIRDEEKTQTLKRLFNISDLEVKALSNGRTEKGEIISRLIIERGALLVLEG